MHRLFELLFLILIAGFVLADDAPTVEFFIGDNPDKDKVRYNQNFISVKAGFEFMNTCYDGEGEDPYPGIYNQERPGPYFGVYGQGNSVMPELHYQLKYGEAPAQDDRVEIYFKPGMTKDSPGVSTVTYIYPSPKEFLDEQGNLYYSTVEVKPLNNKYIDTAYIKFKLLHQELGGDVCCATNPLDIWLAVGTGDYHQLYSGFIANGMEFHIMKSVFYYKKWYWEIVEGDECKGWVKPIIRYGGDDFEMTLSPMISTWHYQDYGFYTFGTGWPASDDNDNIPAGYDPEKDGYFSNMLEHGEFDIFADFKWDIGLDAHLIALDVFETNGTRELGGSFNLFLQGDSPLFIDTGAALLYQPSRIATVSSSTGLKTLNTDSQWGVHFILGNIQLTDSRNFPLNILSNFQAGVFVDGYDDQLQHLQVFTRFNPKFREYFPQLELGIHMGKIFYDSQFVPDFFWGRYTWQIGYYKPVELIGSMGLIYSMNPYKSVDNGGTFIDHGDSWTEIFWGMNRYAGNSLALALQVEGKMFW